MEHMRQALRLGILLVLLESCREEVGKGTLQGTETGTGRAGVAVPRFDGDSARSLVAKQVEFGPRIPGSKAHQQCGDWILERMRQRNCRVTEQKDMVTMHDGSRYQMRNLIAAFRPQASRRILLAAHWDTRPLADMDTEQPRATFEGANDGASGVAVLMELSRHLDSLPQDQGVDILFWDLEDYGDPDFADSYCKGSQYWSRKPHVAGYVAAKGVLLDMVGAEDARFCREGHSMQFAREWTAAIWERAGQLGYGNLFVSEDCQAVTDDHYYVNTLSGIPMVDIIDLRAGGPTGFPPHWHTRSDNLEVISPKTLQAVGQTLLDLLYNP